MRKGAMNEDKKKRARREENELEKSTVVHMVFPSKSPVVCEFVDNMIEDEELCAEQKDDFKEFVKEQVRAAKKARREATAARMRAIEEMSEDDRQAFESIKVYKFYPQLPPDFLGLIKVSYINRYYGKAHLVL